MTWDILMSTDGRTYSKIGEFSPEDRHPLTDVPCTYSGAGTCDKTRESCRPKFENVEFPFKRFPYIPTSEVDV